MAHSLILYDGVCGLCNQLNVFVLKRDRQDHFRFASLQSEMGQSILKKYGKDPYDLNTLYLITDYRNSEERIWSRSAAAVRILFKLGLVWRGLGGMLWLIPLPVRDLGYRFIAATRYRIFGKYEECQIPPKQWQAKFMDSTHG